MNDVLAIILGGRLTGTVSRTVGLGTPRQVQFALRLSF